MRKFLNDHRLSIAIAVYWAGATVIIGSLAIKGGVASEHSQLKQENTELRAEIEMLQSALKLDVVIIRHYKRRATDCESGE